MKIKFYAHASFRLEADGLVIITDPYTPGPGNSGFDPIDEPADIVIMSSATDDFHSDPSHVRGEPIVINALELPPEGTEVRGIPIRSFPAFESKTFDFQSVFGRDPDANALYLFTRTCDNCARRPGRRDQGDRSAGRHTDALLQPSRRPEDRAGGSVSRPFPSGVRDTGSEAPSWS